MQDQPVVGIQLVLVGHVPEQRFLNGEYVLAGRESRAIPDAEDMGVDGDGRMPKGGVENNVGGFPPDAWQGLKRFPVIRHCAAMPLHQQPACRDNVPCLGVEQPDGAYATGDCVDA